MTTARENGKGRSGSAAVTGASTATDRHESHDSVEASGTEYPRILEEHPFVDADGQDNIEATDDRGRRWYHLRPEPRSRADVMGFNSTWWTVLWIVVIVFLVVPW